MESRQRVSRQIEHFSCGRRPSATDNCCFRSPESDHESTRIDVAFKPVEALQLETTLNGLTIRHATGQERTRILSGLSESLDNRNVFICESRSTRGYVVAAVLQIVEDTLGYAAPSGAFDASFAF
jgi:hypothetical protein